MDVKPGNIFLDEQLNARLGDAGMAQDLPVDYSHASLSQIRGTPGYLDVFLTDRCSKPENDIFSFGIGMQLLKTVLFMRIVRKCHGFQRLGRFNRQMSLWPLSLESYGPFIKRLGH